MPCDVMSRSREEQQAREAAFQELVDKLAAEELEFKLNPLTGKPFITKWAETAAAQSGKWEIGCVSARLVREHKEGKHPWMSKLNRGVQRGIERAAKAHNKGHGH